MQHGATAKTRIDHRIGDEARFFRTWIDRPKLMGAVSPSGRFLARTMASHVDPDGTDPIVELGPGTGPITEALLDRGVAPDRLTLVEYDRDFCRLLGRRFPGVHVVNGDAYALGQTLAGIIDRPIGTVVSSLPLLTKTEAHRAALLEDAFALMTPNARFIQFTYGLSSPIRCEPGSSAYRGQVSPLVWLNLPPARVWVYRRADSPVVDAGHHRERRDLIDALRFHTERMQQDLKRELAAATARLRLRPRAEADGLAPAPARPIRRRSIETRTRRP